MIEPDPAGVAPPASRPAFTRAGAGRPGRIAGTTRHRSRAGVARDVVGHLVTWFPGFLEGGAGIALPRGDADADPVGAWVAQAEAVQALLDDPRVGGQGAREPAHRRGAAAAGDRPLLHRRRLHAHLGPRPRHRPGRDARRGHVPRALRGHAADRGASCAAAGSTAPPYPCPTTRTGRRRCSGSSGARSDRGAPLELGGCASPTWVPRGPSPSRRSGRCPTWAAPTWTPCSTVTVALDAVRAGDADHAVVPIENSVEGSVPVTLDELATGEPLMITREMTVPVAFSLLVRRGVDQGRHPVRRHAPARRCADPRPGWRRNLPGVEVVHSTSTAAAAAALALSPSDHDQPPWQAAISAPVAAEHYDLDTLAEGIARQPRRGHPVRAGLASRPPERRRPAATRRAWWRSCARTTRVRCSRSSSSSTMRGVNLTRIESRPTGAALGDYCFSIDAEGHIADQRVGEALMGLRRVCADVRFLGLLRAARRQGPRDPSGHQRRGVRGRRRLAASPPRRLLSQSVVARREPAAACGPVLRWPRHVERRPHPPGPPRPGDQPRRRRHGRRSPARADRPPSRRQGLAPARRRRRSPWRGRGRCAGSRRARCATSPWSGTTRSATWAAASPGRSPSSTTRAPASC